MSPKDVQAQQKDFRDQNLALIQLLSRLESSNLQQHRETRAMILGRNANTMVGQNNEGISANPEPLEVTRDEEEKIRLEIKFRILESLSFSTMTSRFDEVSEAYDNTFNWIFYDSTTQQRPWSSFRDWLIYGRGVYWVNGKAGSGKSTLMRHIVDDPRIQQYLLQWAQERPLSKARFFFWNSGSQEQKSQAGLLRALLYEVLDQHSELIPVVFPGAWARLYTNCVRSMPSVVVESWSLSKLMTGFKILVNQDIVPLNICLFIDGLDEYEGDHEDMAELFKAVTSSKRIKACISSRPWNVFEECFKTCPGLRLQDLTKGDIEHYTNHKFHNSEAFRRLALQQPALATSLVKEIVEYSSGVFLWVRIVVKSLLYGLRNRDGILDLQKRLRLLPRDIEALYAHMRGLTDTIYLEKASMMFQIFRASMNYRKILNSNRSFGHDSLTVLDLALAINEDLNFDRIKLTSASDVVSRCEDMQFQLVASCAGLFEIGEVKLLDIPDIPTFEIRYLHRTARDFIERPDIWKQITSDTAGTSFNPNVSLMKAAIYKVPLWLRHRQHTIYDLVPFGYRAMVYAYHAETETHQSYTRLLDVLDETLAAAQRYFYPGSSLHWSNCIKDSNDDQINFFSLATQFGLSLYLAEKYRDNAINWPRNERPLLDYLLIGNPWIHSADVAVVLLRYGANPNAKYQNQTLWERILTRLREAGEPRVGRMNGEQRRTYLAVLEALIDGGADPKAYFETNTGHRSAVSLIAQEFEMDFPEQVQALEKQLKTRGATKKTFRRSIMGSWFKRLSQ
jgi:hypothetical protein